MSLRCPKCGATYSGAARFCTRDGTQLVSGAKKPADNSVPPNTVPPPKVKSPQSFARALDPGQSHANLAGVLLDGRYQIEKKLGEGGMSFVYLALDTQTGARDAIKVLSPALSRDKTAMARLKREADFGIRLEHPSICHIKRLGETATGLVYVVMPYVEGEVLSDRTYRLGQLPLDEVVGFVREIAAGLHLAHQLKIVHRDLKPENVMITRDAHGHEHAVVMDFGLAKERRAGAELEKLTATGIVLGTPEFMSPEQLRGKPLDGRTDVYALALMTIEMLTGKLPFAGKSQQELMIARLRDMPVPIRKLRPDLTFSAAVERVLLKGMERVPDERYQTAPEFADAFAAAAGRTPTAIEGTTGVLKKLFGRATTVAVVAAVLATPTARSVAAQQTTANAPTTGSTAATSKHPTRPPAATPAASNGAAATAAGAPPDTTHKLSGAIGVAIDSVHGGPLAGAVVSIAGTDRQATTDSAGQFRIDSVPPGTYKLALFHPVLDSVGVSIASQGVVFPAGRYAVVRIATPSPTTLANVFCPAEKRLTGPSVVIGRVLDADTDAPDSGARVTLSWTELEVGRSVGIRHTPRVRQTTVDASGTFQICGVPNNMNGTLRATRGTAATAGVPVAIEGRLLTLAALSLAAPDSVVVAVDSTPRAASAPKAPAPAAATGLRSGHAVATGRVTDQGGRPIAGASIGVLGAVATTVSDDSGRFTLRGLPSGTQALSVRKLTYSPAEMPVALTVRAPRYVDVRLKTAPPQLASVNVQATKLEQGLKKVGFTDRKKMGLGHFMTEDQIANKMPQNMTDVFTTMPGITVNYSSGQPVLQGSRTAGGGCVTYYVDDVPYREQTPGDLNDYMRPEELSAVEVYNASDVPAEYAQAGHSSCTTIVMWTKTKIGG